MGDTKGEIMLWRRVARYLLPSIPLALAFIGKAVSASQVTFLFLLDKCEEATPRNLAASAIESYGAINPVCMLRQQQVF